MAKIFNSIPTYHGKKDENLGLWLKKVETAFALDETSMDLRVDQVVVKLDGIAGDWYANHRELWNNWADFKRAIQARFQATQASRSLWLSLLQAKQGRMNVREYVDQFYCKYNEFLRVWRLEQELKNSYAPSTSFTTEKKEPSVEIKSMVKDAFIDGLDSKVKFIILQSNPDTLEDAITTASRLFGIEGGTIAQTALEDVVKIDEDGDVEMKITELAKELGSMKLMLSKFAGRQEPVREGCYSCGRQGHIARDCKVPCQHCGKTGHAPERCRKQRPGGFGERTKSDINYVANMWETLKEDIAEIYQVKRSMENEPDARKKLKIETLLNPIQQDNQWQGSSTSRNKKEFVKKQYPLRNEPITHQELDIRKLLENAVVPTSLAVLLKEVGHLRTDLKHLLTTPRKETTNGKAKEMDTRRVSEGQDRVDHTMLQETLLITDKGAPRTRVFLNGECTTALLDGGSATNIVSLCLLEKLGVQDLLDCNTIFALADGSKKKAIGQDDQLELEIQGTTKLINAVVFDHQDYELLLGRPGLITFGISTDWSRQKWKIIRNNKEIPLPIIYEHRETQTNVYLIGYNEPNTESQQEAQGIQNALVKQFLEQQRELLIENMDELKAAKVEPLTFNVEGNKPVKLRPYQLPYSHEKVVNSEITEMVQRGIIEPSTAAWRSPVVVVNKKGGKLRLCIDYREVNKLIQESAICYHGLTKY